MIDISLVCGEHGPKESPDDCATPGCTNKKAHFNASLCRRCIQELMMEDRHEAREQLVAEYEDFE